MTAQTEQPERAGVPAPSTERNHIMQELTDSRIHDLLATRREIAVIWCIEDVQEIRPDLTEDQCWQVLETTSRYHDATIGINWDVLRCQADILFCSTSTDAKEQP